MAEEKVISIEVNRTHGILVTPMVLRINTNNNKDKINVSFTKVSKDDDYTITSYTIQFKGLSPLNKAYIMSGETGPIYVRGNVEPGSYPYAIAVTDSDGNTHLDAVCPGIIIDW